MTVVRKKDPIRSVVTLACVAGLLAALSVAAVAEGPPPCEPPAGYVPPEVDVRVVGLMQGQLVELGSTHLLRAEALDEEGVPWGDRFDWYLDGEHVAEGPDFRWTVSGHGGARRVTLVVSSGDDAVWGHVDVDAGSAPGDPPSWLGPAMRALPLAALAVWLLVVHRQMARRRAPPGGSR